MRRTDMRRRGLLVACIAGLLSGCGAAAPAAPPNVIVIVADTLRADRTGFSGSTLGLTPFLDSYAAHATVFHRAYTGAPWTLPSVATLLTSRFPSQHGVVARDSVLPAGEVTLAEVLRERGYATAAVSANGLMRAEGGLGQGFELFDVLWKGDEDGGKVTGDVVNKVALAWLDGLRRGSDRLPPVFLYVHYMEPHLPYLPNEDALQRVLAGRPRPDLAALNALTPIMTIVPNLDELMPQLREGYDASVATLDGVVLGLMTELGQRHLLDNSVVVFTADHGEEFREHGRFGHGNALYEEVVRVPLFLLRSGRQTRTDVQEVISLVDVAPTILAEVGVPAPPAFVGTPWTPGAAAPSHPAFVELVPIPGSDAKPAWAVVLGTHKRIVAGDDRVESFDLAADPGERNPAGFGEAEGQRLDQALASFRERLGEGGPRVVEPLDDAAKARLRALGYTH